MIPEGTPTIPIDALFAADGVNPNPESDPQQTLDEADLIFGIDVMTGHSFLLFGRDVLERILRTGVEESVRVLAIELDQDSDELERACALMEVVKGRHDYPRRDD